MINFLIKKIFWTKKSIFQKCEFAVILENSQKWVKCCQILRKNSFKNFENNIDKIAFEKITTLINVKVYHDYLYQK
jgi:hypothetical protein